MGTVYIVHCIDTEGPLYEAETVPFELIDRVFGIKIFPSKENLVKLQNGEIDLQGREKAVQNLVDKHKIETKGTWEEIEKTLAIITSEEYRKQFVDSTGNGWIYSWFCMDHVGFTGDNPRRRDAGYHKVFDRYMNMVQKQNMGDIVQFHYHPVSFSGNYNDSGISFWGSDNLNQILCRKIIERQWFPTAFRPGFHTERPDSNWFLEQWIPFDYGNQAVSKEETDQIDLSEGRFGDWRHAPLSWYPYHPSHDDYQLNGQCRRWITRCLNMYARVRQLEIDDVRDAFLQARRGRNTILSFTNHDYKDMPYEIERVRKIIKQVSLEYPDVNFQYADAISAIRKCLGLKQERVGLEMKLCDKERRILVTSENAIFGPQPYLAIKSKTGKYYWDNFDFTAKNIWSYTFDANTIEIEKIDKIGVATNNAFGCCEVVLLDDLGKIQKKTYN